MSQLALDEQPCVVQVGDDDLVQPHVDRIGAEAGRPVFVIAGWAANMPPGYEDRLERAFREVLVPVLSERKAIVVTGGTDAGIMRIAGRAFREAGSGCKLVGVAPAARLAVPGSELSKDDAFPESHHHFIFAVPGSKWGDELEFMAKFVDRLADTSSVTMIVAGGAGGAEREFRLARSRGWPVLLLRDTGGTAHARSLDRKRDCSVGVANARDAADVHRSLIWHFSRDRQLRSAWARVAWLDAKAQAAQPRYRAARASVFVLGVITTLVGVAVTAIGADPWRTLLRYSLVALPLISAAILSWIARLQKDRRWVSVRHAAEGIKRQIYLFRSRVKPYDRKDRREQLVRSIGEVEAHLSREVASAVGTVDFSSWPPRPTGLFHAEDDLLSPLKPKDYVRLRLVDQLAFFGRQATRDDATLTRRIRIVLGLSILATMVAAIVDNENWTGFAAVVAAVGAVFSAQLAYDQIEDRIERAGVTAASLRILLDKSHVRSKPSIARDAEKVLEDETTDWARSMRLSNSLLGTREQFT